MYKKVSKLKSALFVCLLAGFFVAGCSSSKHAAQLSSTDVKNMIDSSRFDFVAERMTPLRGRSRYLTSRYDLTVKKDILISFLPYFGRAQVAPMDPSKGPLSFTSKNFTYDVTQKKNDEWQVLIRPKDFSDVQQLIFNIFGNGTATLNVVSLNRDAISFTGHIEKVNH